MSILSLDIGKTTGWARSDRSSGVFEAGGFLDYGEAGARFGQWLADQFTETSTTRLLIERPFFRERTRGADLVLSLVWAAHSTAFLWDVPRHEETADAVRKALLGRSRRPTDMPLSQWDHRIAAATRGHGFAPGTPHEADAAALLIVCEMASAREVVSA